MTRWLVLVLANGCLRRPLRAGLRGPQKTDDPEHEEDFKHAFFLTVKLYEMHSKYMHQASRFDPLPMTAAS